MKKILIFSDSHNKNEIMLKIILKEKPDLVLHAGDYCCDSKKISKFVDFFCSGNNDFDERNNAERDVVVFEYENLKFLITHSDKENNLNNSRNVKEILLKKYDIKNIDIYVYGHSHIEDIEIIENILFVNPGSISLPRNLSRIPTYAILFVEKGRIMSNLKKDVIKFYNENN